MADIDTSTASPARTATLTERQSPGRVENPDLVKLLRNPDNGPRPAEPATAEAGADALAPARGIVLGMLLGAGVWVAGVLTVWLLL